MKDWQRVGAAVQSARLQRGLKQSDLGVSKQTVINLENAHKDNYQALKLHAVETALGWPPGSILSIAEGGDIPDTPGRVDELSLLRQDMAEIKQLLQRLVGALLEGQERP